MELTLHARPTVAPRQEAALVEAARAGDDRAFEELYSRYRERIHAFILSRVRDHGRAEDLGQEVFLSALRQLRATDRPIAFKPWLYTIAKNACIDDFRRTARERELPVQDGEELAEVAGDGHGSAGPPTPTAAIETKQRLDDLRGAFGGLSDNQHRLLVLREFEGLSYDEIGERLGMTRQMVESGLFRARRKLGEEYAELASGRRCAEIQDAVQAGRLQVARALGIKDRRRYARHLSHCEPCRHVALMVGVDEALLKPRSIAARVAALLPLPLLRRLWPFGHGSGAGGAGAGGAGAGAGGAGAGAGGAGAGAGAAGAGGGGVGAAGAGAAGAGAAGAGFGAAQAAALLVAAAAGVGGSYAIVHGASADAGPTSTRIVHHAPARTGARHVAPVAQAPRTPAAPGGTRHTGGHGGHTTGPARVHGGGAGAGSVVSHTGSRAPTADPIRRGPTTTHPGAGTTTSGGSTSTRAPTTTTTATTTAGRSTTSTATTSAVRTSATTTVAVTVPPPVKTVTSVVRTVVSGATNGVGTIVTSATNGVGTVVSGATNGVGTIVTGATNGVKTTLDGVTGGLSTAVNGVVSGSPTGVTNGVKTTLNGVTDGVKTTLGGVTNGVQTTLSGVTNGVQTTLNGVAGGVATTLNGAGQGVGGLLGGSH